MACERRYGASDFDAPPAMTFAQQLEKAAEQSQEQGPEPPQRPPPKRTEGLGARAALNALKNLGNVAQFSRWSSGNSAAAAGDASNLPTVAKPPVSPAPPSSARRGRPSRGRSSSSLTPRDESSNTPRQPQSAREQSPSLPSVRPSTPTQPSPPVSARASVKMSYQMTPRELEAPAAADGPTESPVPRRPRSKGASAEATSQSSPAAPAPQANNNCREMLEVQGNAQKLLEAVFEIHITEEAAISILDSYPELVWLANCLRRCPLPPGWTALEAGAGKLTYVDMGTGASSEVSPLMARFADLGRLMLHWRQNPSAEAEVSAALASKRDQDTEDAARARKVWKGPHQDPKTGADFWHCPATGRSTWGDPGMAAEFLARISDRLQKALPSSATAPAAGSEAQAKDAPSTQPSKAEDDGNTQEAELAAATEPSAKHRPETPLEDRRSQVAEMMKEVMDSSKPAASSRPKMPRPTTGKGSRPASPSPRDMVPPNAPRGKPTTSASEPNLGQVAEEVSQDFRARRRSASISRERERELSEDRPICGRICPGQDLRVTGHQMQEQSEMTPRFRRRRMESTERLDPLGDASRPPSSRGLPEPEASKRDPMSAEAIIAPAFEPGPAEMQIPSERPPTGGGRRAPRPASRGPSFVGPRDDRPRTRRGDNSEENEADVLVIDNSDRKVATMSATFNGTGGGFGLSNTAMERMCVGAIQAAINTAFGETSPGHSAELDEEDGIVDCDDVDADAEMAAVAAAKQEEMMEAKQEEAQREEEMKKSADEEDAVNCDDAGTAEIAAIAAAEEQMAKAKSEEAPCDAQAEQNLSMSLMSICVPRSPSPKKVRAPLSPHAESPSIIALTDDEDEPRWTSHKPLPKPKTPPRSAPPRSSRREKSKERAVLLGVPEPLSARGRARCDPNGAPLSARGPRHHARPGNRRGSVGGA